MTRKLSTIYVLPLLLLAAALDAAAQGRVVIVDAEDGQPIPYATVRFTCLEGGCTDSAVSKAANGEGIAGVPFRGRVAVAVQSLGYQEGADTTAAEGTTIIRLTPNGFTGEQVVVTGQYAPTGTDQSLYDVRVISGEEIEERAAQNLRDLMGSELNVRVSQDNVLGSSMSIQGVSGQNVKILVDGLPLVGRVGGDIDVSQILLNNVERVELVEGPLSVAYGTDALGGVVNLITDKRTGNGFAGEATAYHESAGTWNADGRVGALLGNTRVMVSGGRHFFGGFARPDTSRFKRWKPREQYFLDWDGTYYLGKFSLGYSGRFFNEYILNRGLPRAPYGETAFDDTYRTNRLTNRIQMRGDIGKSRLELSAALSNYTRRKNTYFKDLVTLEEELTASPSDQDTSRFDTWNFRGTYGGEIGLFPASWQTGFEANIDKAAGDRIDTTGRTLGDYALFASLRYTPVGRFTVQPGLRYAYNTEYDAPLIPSLNVKYEPGRNFTLRASYARGFRAPSLRDLYFLFVDINHNIQGNPDLRAEVSDNFQASVSWKRASVRKVLEVSATGFYNDITDLITLANIQGDLYSYQNVGTYKTTGVKLNGRYERERFSVRLGASMIGRYNQFSESDDVPSFLFSPEIAGGGMWKIPAILELALDYKYTGRLPSYALDGNGTLQERFIDDYHTLNASVARSFFNDRLTLRIGGKNLLDVTDVTATAAGDAVHSSETSSLPVSWGRTFFADINIAVR